MTDLPLIRNHLHPVILQQALWLTRNIDIVRFLVEEAGADVNYASCEHFIRSPLDVAVDRELEMVKYLLSVGADVDGRRGLGTQKRMLNCHTALQLGTIKQNVDMELIHILLEHGADVNAPGASNEWAVGGGFEGGWTALQGAAFGGHINLVHFLLQRGADVNAEGCDSEHGRTALEFAAECGHLDTVQLLLDAGATKLERAAKLAERYEYFVIANLLKTEMKKRGCDYNDEDTDSMEDEDGDTDFEEEEDFSLTENEKMGSGEEDDMSATEFDGTDYATFI